ncbi:unnamed protein product [Sphagnum jensenii]|uniref:Uncharacterized protein n=1 Tax=Sphagnum jensenii TaxID=128206 RepID=A0ABP1BDN3_9BRYO
MQLNFQLGIRRVLPAYYILAYVFLITTWSPVEFLKVESTCVPPTGCTAALYYIVQQGDTLANISNKFQTNNSIIQTYNPNIQNVNYIEAGNPIYIPFTCSCTNDQLLKQFFYSGQNGDNLTSIASGIYENFTQYDWIAAASANNTQPGQPLQIPVNCTCGNPSVSTKYGFFATYVVQNGDTESRIASKFNITESLLQQYNPGVNLLSLPTSSILFVPAKGTSSNGNGVNVGVIVGPLVGALVLGAAIALGLYCCYIKNPRKQELKREQLLRSSAAHSQDGSSARAISANKSARDVSLMLAERKSVEFSYEELAAATDNFSISHKIGQGGFASVYFGEIHNQKLAIKKMTLQATKAFLAELQVLTHVHHTNLVQLIGYCTDQHLFLVYEYIDNGTLDQHLHGKVMPPLTWSQRVQIALDAARGLEYIHEHIKPTYIHRDIKSANILIDRDLHAKVADFGLAKLTSSGTGTHGIVGTFGYALYGEISPKVDVFSFGVVLYEMISGRGAILQGDLSTSSPQSGSLQGRTLTSLFEQVVHDPNGKEKLRGLLDPVLKDDYPLDAVWKVAQLAEHCTRANAKNRPTMRFVVVQLMTLADTITQGWEMSSFPRDSMSTDSGILRSEYS